MRVADAESLPFDDATFDAVLCGFGIFFFPHPEVALREFARVLRPRGRVGLSTWTARTNADFQWWFDLVAAFMPETAARTDRQLFKTPDEIIEPLEAAGFTGVDVVEAPMTLRLADAETWWRWTWSLGTRGPMERMDEDTLARFKKAAFEHLAGVPEAPAVNWRADALLAAATKS